ncbi:MAG TPA: hypothetical protein VJ327_01755 [Patescibacteria group bacterium]|nr:hypothetical protein [Patescibacteria group bacterium]
MTIEILKFIPINKGACIGYLDIFVPKTGLEIYGCCIWQKDNNRWLNMPQREYTNPQGEKKYLNIIRFREKGHADEFGRVALEAFDAWVKTQPTQPTQATQPAQAVKASIPPSSGGLPW